MALGPSKILITPKKSLEILITLEKSLNILITTWGFSYLPPMIGVLDNSYLIQTSVHSDFLSNSPNKGWIGIFPFFPILIIDGVLDVIIFVIYELWGTHSLFTVHLRMVMSLGVKTRLLLIEFTISTTSFNQIYD